MAAEKYIDATGAAQPLFGTRKKAEPVTGTIMPTAEPYPGHLVGGGHRLWHRAEQGGPSTGPSPRRLPTGRTSVRGRAPQALRQRLRCQRQRADLTGRVRPRHQGCWRGRKFTWRACVLSLHAANFSSRPPAPGEPLPPPAWTTRSWKWLQTRPALSCSRPATGVSSRPLDTPCR